MVEYFKVDVVGEESDSGNRKSYVNVVDPVEMILNFHYKAFFLKYYC